MKSEPLVSIIVPIYNSAQYLPECLESIRKQTYKNLEVILVNDDSKDDSEKICKKFQKEVAQVKYLTVKYHNAALVRRDGIMQAHAKYICFCDSDDVIDNIYVERLLKALLDARLEVSACKLNVFSGDQVVKGGDKNGELGVSHDAMKMFADNYHMTLESAGGFVMQSINAKMFEKRLFEQVDFSVIKTRILEDNFILPQIYKALREDEIATIDAPLYHYRLHGDSTMSSVSLEEKIPYGDEMISYPELFKRAMDYIERLFCNNSSVSALLCRIKEEEFFHYAKVYFEQRGEMPRLNEELERLREEISKKDSAIVSKDRKISELETSIADITSSRAYRIFITTITGVKQPLRLTKKLLSNGVRSVRRCIPHRYFISRPMAIEKSANIAVVIHLFYFEHWKGVFQEKLDVLSKSAKFDLFITMPEANQKYIKIIKKDYPQANIFIVPNRGRDVLPFVMVLKELGKAEYKTVLKMHSKKSPHYTGGYDWLKSTVDNLVPKDKRALDDIIETTRSKQFGIAGPEEYYYPLEVNFHANGVSMAHIMKDAFNRKIARESLQLRRADYGYFGGTMFWASVDAIIGLAKYFQVDFEAEAGQIDGTFAHALERAFSLVPEVKKLNIYGIRDGKIKKIDYKTANFPDWFEAE